VCSKAGVVPKICRKFKKAFPVSQYHYQDVIEREQHAQKSHQSMLK
jgi:hypothetical protein